MCVSVCVCVWRKPLILVSISKKLQRQEDWKKVFRLSFWLSKLFIRIFGPQLLVLCTCYLVSLGASRRSFNPPLSLGGSCWFSHLTPLGHFDKDRAGPYQTLGSYIPFHFSTRQFSPRQLCHFSGKKKKKSRLSVILDNPIAHFHSAHSLPPGRISIT